MINKRSISTNRLIKVNNTQSVPVIRLSIIFKSLFPLYPRVVLEDKKEAEIVTLKKNKIYSNELMIFASLFSFNWDKESLIRKELEDEIKSTRLVQTFKRKKRINKANLIRATYRHKKAQISIVKIHYIICFKIILNFYRFYRFYSKDIIKLQNLFKFCNSNHFTQWARELKCTYLLSFFI